MVRDYEIDDKLFPLAFQVVSDKKRCEMFAVKIKELAKPDATKTIVDEVENLLK
jgi:UDP-N-acetylglucosamine--N-acetylmuramyl-(pentapeptide) pyrophosphoryl-undecaprenol N-acetylglucosamine transferase